MTYTVRQLALHQNGKTLAVLYALLGVVLMPVLIIGSLLAPQEERLGIGFWLAFPVFYAVIGYVGVVLFCALYNVAARLVGGMQAELEPKAGQATGG